MSSSVPKLVIGSVDSFEISSMRLVDAAHPRQLLGRDRLGDEVRARAAVLDRQTERRQLHRHQGVERVPVISGEMVGLRGPRGDLVLAELAHDLAELALLVGQRDRLHGPSVAPRSNWPLG